MALRGVPMLPYPGRSLEFRKPNCTIPIQKGLRKGPPQPPDRVHHPSTRKWKHQLCTVHHKGRLSCVWRWRLNKWNESNMCTPELNFPIKQWALPLPTQPLRITSDQGRGAWNDQKICSPFHYIYLPRTPKGAQTKKRNNIKASQIAAQTPLLVQSLVREAIHLHRASTMCQGCQDLAGPPDYIQFLVHKQSAQAPNHVTLCTVIIIWTSVDFSQPSF
jgi:hypothetical protein